MAKLTVQEIIKTGLTAPTGTACSEEGDNFVNDGRTFLKVTNGDASSHTVTIEAQRVCELGVLHDIEVAVPDGAEKWIGPFPKSFYNDGNGLVQFSCDDETSMTAVPVKLPE